MTDAARIQNALRAIEAHIEMAEYANETGAEIPIQVELDFLTRLVKALKGGERNAHSL